MADKNTSIIPVVAGAEYEHWLTQQSTFHQQWLLTSGFCAKAGQVITLPTPAGDCHAVLVAIEDEQDFWGVAKAVKHLPSCDCRIADQLQLFGMHALWRAHLAVALDQYQFTRYKKSIPTKATLILDERFNAAEFQSWCDSYFLVRDLINTPCEDMGPPELATVAKQLAKEHNAKIAVIEGEKLIKAGFEAIYTVGRAGSRPPCLIELRWGDKNAPLITLVGKGICFDTGGLDIKPPSGMALMKKDMGGAALCLGLAKLIMQNKIPLQLRVLLACAENNVGSHSYRPGDVIKMRNGLHVEVTNTDAEGRLVLADALVYACEEKPAILIDAATLTGAARIALGPDLPVLLGNDSTQIAHLLAAGETHQDELGLLPLHQRYNQYLKSSIADLVNSTANRYAGTITAALFLEHFVQKDTPWLHIDTYAWNPETQPGRPKGGEALALRALFHYLVDTFVK